MQTIGKRRASIEASISFNAPIESPVRDLLLEYVESGKSQKRERCQADNKPTNPNHHFVLFELSRFLEALSAQVGKLHWN